MADGDGEDDGIEDIGAPPVVPGMRVWTDPTGGEPPTAEERARFNIPEPSQAAAEAMRKIATKQEAAANAPPAGPDPRVAVLAALVAKFPEFNADWPEKVQERWFSGFERIMDAGLK